MARAVSARRKTVVTVIAWTVGLLIFFPILWTILTSFKSEAEAIASQPKFLMSDWTVENYATVQERSDYFRHFWNSVVISVGTTLLNLPIVVWMLYAYFKEIPGKTLEAARMDGASLRSEILYVLAPMAVPGIVSTLLLDIILAGNEAFWTLNLTAFIASHSSPEGLFYAKLSAASTSAIAPILILGWFSQKQLVRGLTFGAVK